jgi:NAD+ synthase (glutamine-hydrolysing)
MSIRMAVAQFNYVVGDLRGNAQRIIEAAREAARQGADLLLTPELALTGYAAEDLYHRPGFLRDVEAAVAAIAQATAELEGLYVVLGHPHALNASARSRNLLKPAASNAASVLHRGEVLLRYDKQSLPNYQVFDEQRYFVPGHRAGVFEVKGLRLGLLICEDAWVSGPAQQAVDAGAQALLLLNASPFHGGKSQEREQAMGACAAAVGVPLLYAHLVGGQDEVVFEGRSFALDAQGQTQCRAPGFEEAMPLWTLAEGQWQGDMAGMAEPLSDLWQALVMGTRDYIVKNGFPGVVLGLSGGIDSALVLAVAVDALGADRVRAVMMPSPYTADISWLDAREMAQRLGVRYDEIDIAPHFEVFKASLAQEFAGRAEDATEENLQARIRGTLLMALSNKYGSLVLTTGNKSEMTTGYCTLYGDMAGGFAVIKDVVKTQVFALARWRNAHDPFGTGAAPIPERIITRPPSAELRPDQVDQDSLPPYETLDAIIQAYMEDDDSAAEIIASGHEAAHVEQVIRLLRINEYKRRQAPVGIRVTHRSFGKDWRYPITNGYRAGG